MARGIGLSWQALTMREAIPKVELEDVPKI